MGQEAFEELLRLFKALADQSRLQIVGILAGRECSVQELATLVALKEPTVSHHLAKLKEAGLVRMRAEGTTHLYRFDGEALRAANRALLTREKLATLVDDLDPDSWERSVLRAFFEGERLKEIPASRKKRRVVLEWLAGRFEPGVRYPEREVNEIIKRHHPDSATLRRELVDAGLLARQAGVYWRLAEAPRAEAGSGP